MNVFQYNSHGILIKKPLQKTHQKHTSAKFSYSADV